MEYLPFSWEEASDALRGTLTSQVREGGFRPDSIIAISRGGLVPARILSDSLNVPLLYTIRISFYSKVGIRKETPEVTQPLDVDVGGQKLLVVDDISDSGKSLVLANEYLSRFGPREIKTATIHFKPGSVFRPDFFCEETHSWVVYPWETEEFFRETGKRVEDL